ncbi:MULTISPECIES: beta-1,6-N-acetylglucosaminyltransferase [unclassified Providencia]|uniref:beta-1,6-N-acetylglucosaminyltransferase n=1 Tax=unclassified Providencia TaxID=2633465 RepID=UPI0029905E45|nr:MULTISPECIES: beta-1,6-N-acetylglucosaminyltransferase [unclassified Providencia]
MKTAVLIQTHKNSKYLCILAKKNPTIRFYIHVDKKSPLIYEEIKSQNIPNITLLEDRIDVYWGGYSQVAATLKLLTTALLEPNNKYFHFLSSECYPLKRFNEIEEEWNITPQNNYIESHLNKSNDWRLKVLIPHVDTHFFRSFLGRVLNKLIKLSSFIVHNSKIPKDNFYFGSSWFSINRDLAQSIIDINNSTTFFHDFKKITCSDEHAFQILVRKFNIQGITDDNKRFVIFKGKANPEYLTIQQIKEVQEKNNYWFIRKVDEKTSLSLLDNK